jgi:hypothetical protein
MLPVTSCAAAVAAPLWSELASVLRPLAGYYWRVTLALYLVCERRSLIFRPRLIAESPALSRNAQNEPPPLAVTK